MPPALPNVRRAAQNQGSLFFVDRDRWTSGSRDQVQRVSLSACAYLPSFKRKSKLKLSLCAGHGVKWGEGGRCTRALITNPLKTTVCPRRNVPGFGRVFLMLKYTDITQNTYVQSWTVTEIKAREMCGLLAVPRTVPGSRDVIPIRCALSVLVYSRLKRLPRCDCTCKVLGNPKETYDMSASVL